MGVVGDAGEMPAQLNRSGELTALVEGGPDRRGLGFGDDEHRRSKGGAGGARQVAAGLAGTPNVVRSALVCTPAEPLAK
jgi:hypothetical protein